MLTTFAEEDQVRAAIQGGAIGYLLKDVLKPELLSAIRAAAQGTPTSAIFTKLGVTDRTQAALLAVRHGLGEE
jgi:DNA-binding NarL/FixJ family response regulator